MTSRGCKEEIKVVTFYYTEVKNQSGLTVEQEKSLRITGQRDLVNEILIT